MTHQVAVVTGGASAEKVNARIPMGRTAQPDDIADAIAVLAAGRVGYMNGCAWVIDGGWTAI